MPRPSHALKLAWAHEHLKALSAEVQWWIRSDPYRTSTEADPQTSAETLYIEPIGDPPAKLSLIVGDVVHNLRSALDHLALALAEANTSGPVPPKVEKDSQFPICSTKKIFRDGCERRIGSVHQKAQARMQGLQPYRRGNAWERHPLWLLREVSDFDKHRRLPLVGAYVNRSAVTFPSMNIHVEHIEFHGSEGPLETKTPLLTVRNPVDWKTGAKVDVNAEFSLSVAFSDQAPLVVAGRDVVEILSEIGDYIADTVIPELKPFLQ